MKKLKLQHAYLPLALLLTLFVAGCSSGSSSSDSTPVPTDTTTDTSAPTVTLTFPAESADVVATNTKIGATFSEAMDPLTLTDQTFTLKAGATAVPGTVDSLNNNAVFTPGSALSPSTLYTATLTTGAKDLAGNPLAADKVWTFTTGLTEDPDLPTVESTNPTNGASEVILSKKVQATFSESMNPLTIATSFTLMNGVTVPGTVSYVGLVATFTPESALEINTTYTATITTAAEDMASNKLAVAKTWTFTTTAVEPVGPLAVDLGTAGDFVLLSKTAISTTGATAITGDIGVSPVAATFMTGFGLTMDASNEFSTSPLITGRAYAADYTPPTPAKMTTAISDMQTAYTDAAGRTLPDFTELGAGDISGMTLVPGLYKWGTGVLIDNSGVTLTGNADDVWILQITGDLTVASNAIVTLAGNAQAKNVFWQVAGGSGVIIGTSAQFQGIILARTAVNFGTGATLLNGRALAQTAISLDANAVTAP